MRTRTPVHTYTAFVECVGWFSGIRRRSDAEGGIECARPSASGLRPGQELLWTGRGVTRVPLGRARLKGRKVCTRIPALVRVLRCKRLQRPHLRKSGGLAKSRLGRQRHPAYPYANAGRAVVLRCYICCTARRRVCTGACFSGVGRGMPPTLYTMVLALPNLHQRTGQKPQSPTCIQLPPSGRGLSGELAEIVSRPKRTGAEQVNFGRNTEQKMGKNGQTAHNRATGICFTSD